MVLGLEPDRREGELGAREVILRLAVECVEGVPGARERGACVGLESSHPVGLVRGGGCAGEQGARVADDDVGRGRGVRPRFDGAGDGGGALALRAGLVWPGGLLEERRHHGAREREVGHRLEVVRVALVRRDPRVQRGTHQRRRTGGVPLEGLDAVKDLERGRAPPQGGDVEPVVRRREGAVVGLHLAAQTAQQVELAEPLEALAQLADEVADELLGSIALRDGGGALAICLDPRRVGPVALAHHATEGEPGSEPDRQDEHRRHRDHGPVSGDPARDPRGQGVRVGGDELACLEAPQVLRHRPRIGIAGVGIARHRLLDDRQQIGRQLGYERAQRLRGTREHAIEDVRRGAPVRGLPGQHVVDESTEGVHVGPGVDPVAASLLRGHVVRRPERHADLREPRARGQSVAARIRGGLDRIELTDGLGDSPVDDDRLAERADQHVRGLEVAVDHALLVSECESLGHRDDVGQEPEALPPRRHRDHGVEGAPSHELHHQERLLVGPAARLVEGNHAWMLQAACDASLAREASAHRRVGVKHRLQGHRPAVPAVPGLEHPPHAAAGDLTHHFEPAAVDEGEARDVRRGRKQNGAEAGDGSGAHRDGARHGEPRRSGVGSRASRHAGQREAGHARPAGAAAGDVRLEPREAGLEKSSSEEIVERVRVGASLGVGRHRQNGSSAPPATQPTTYPLNVAARSATSR
jgi:hypothetical protein